MATQRYVISPRRESRERTPEDWVQRINAIDGVSVVGSTPRRAQVAADEGGIARLRESFGSEMLIEPIIPHYTQDQGGESEPGAS